VSVQAVSVRCAIASFCSTSTQLTTPASVAARALVDTKRRARRDFKGLEGRNALLWARWEV
jgi:hypothetical protein